MKKILAGILAVTTICGCSKKTVDGDTGKTDIATVEASAVALGYKSSKPMNAVPKATAFRMSGDYSDNVAITMNGDNIVYYPAPSDITENSKPISLGDGWWLNRQGIAQNSVFTKYTFEEYAKLKQVPSVEELKASIIPGAHVTQIHVLPYSINDAPSKLHEIRNILKN